MRSGSYTLHSPLHQKEVWAHTLYSPVHQYEIRVPHPALTYSPVWDQGTTPCTDLFTSPCGRVSHPVLTCSPVWDQGPTPCTHLFTSMRLVSHTLHLPIHQDEIREPDFADRNPQLFDSVVFVRIPNHQFIHPELQDKTGRFSKQGLSKQEREHEQTEARNARCTSRTLRVSCWHLKIKVSKRSLIQTPKMGRFCLCSFSFGQGPKALPYVCHSRHVVCFPQLLVRMLWE